MSTLTDYLRILRKRKLLVLSAVVCCAATALAASMATIPVYQASAKLLVMARAQPSGGVSSAYEGALLSQQLMQSFAAVIEARPTAEAALRRQYENIPAGVLQQRIKADPIPDTLLIELSYEDIDPARAQRLTNAVALAFVSQVPGLQGGSTVRVSLVEPALRPTVPVRPQTRFNVALAAMLGLMLGVGFAYLAEHLDTSIRSADTLEAAADAPVVGTIPLFAASEQPLPVVREPRSVEAEAFRKLRTNLSFLGVDRGSLCCVVTSPSVGEGKSTVTANLAMAIAQSGLRVIVVEADLRRPTVHRLFGLQQRVGTTTVLLDHVDIDDALHRLDDEPVAVLTSGQVPPNPSELLGSRPMGELVAELRRRADVVLIDSAPVLPVADPVVVSQFADGVLLVARAGATTRDHIKAARAACDRGGARVLGVVLNAAPFNADRAAYYGYYGPREPEAVHANGNGAGSQQPAGNGAGPPQRASARTRRHARSKAGA
jgi:capsular exopolysaccharide synthesis family protein